MSDPWLKFYTSDWRSDPKLRNCSIGARGLWIEMICLMHEATPRGYLVFCGKNLTVRQVAIQTGCTVDEAHSFMLELEENEVFSRNDDGLIFSRRMVKDEAASVRNRANGKGGGNPLLKQSDNQDLESSDKQPVNRGVKATRARDQIPEARDQIPEGQKPGPEVGGAQLPLVENYEALAVAAKAAPATKAIRGHRLPEDWKPSEADTDFAKSLGFERENFIREVRMFRNYFHSATGTKATKTNWSKVFHNWLDKSNLPRGKTRNGQAQEFADAFDHVRSFDDENRAQEGAAGLPGRGLARREE